MGIMIPTMGIDAAARASVPSRRESLAGALFTGTQQRLLGLLFGQPKRSFFVTELIELAGTGRGAVQRELSRLERSGLVSMEKRGNQKYYQANPSASIYKELCSIVRKTVGSEETIRAALEPLDEQIAVALIYGSVAKGKDTAKGDIDLLVVADDTTLEELYACTEPAEKLLGRAINLTLFTKREFSRRQNSGNAFLERILDGPTILLRGMLDAA